MPSMSNAGPEAPGDSHRLPLGTRLGEFEITGLVGEGGFGIVYLAYDHSLDRKVAMKEYMPSAARAAHRRIAGGQCAPNRHAETFEAGLRSFINEAKLLAQFDHPSLVKVYRFWEANGTAYMVMPFYEGITLKDDAAGPWRPAARRDVAEVAARARSSTRSRSFTAGSATTATSRRTTS